MLAVLARKGRRAECGEREIVVGVTAGRGESHAMGKVSKAELMVKEWLDEILLPEKYPRWDNIRPSWLHGMELDRFYPDLDLGIEINGPQHRIRVPAMQSPEDYRSQRLRDFLKRKHCRAQGVWLMTVNLLWKKKQPTPEHMKKVLTSRVYRYLKKFNARATIPWQVAADYRSAVQHLRSI